MSGCVRRSTTPGRARSNTLRATKDDENCPTKPYQGSYRLVHNAKNKTYRGGGVTHKIRQYVIVFGINTDASTSAVGARLESVALHQRSKAGDARPSSLFFGLIKG